MPGFLIIDGNSIINRAFYGIRPLSTREGIPTNGIYGFINIMEKAVSEIKPDYLAVAFDVSRKTFRNEMYAEYKANRSGMPDELAAQMPYLKELLSAMNINCFELENYEADDIIGTVSKNCEKENIECYILTGDRDDLQLASKKTRVMLVTTKGGKTGTDIYDDKAVFEKYGLTPYEFIHLKGLMGDSSDNIPGVAGVGEVTATKLLKEFSTIDKVYENIDSKTISKGVREKLLKDKEMAFLSLQLATINREVPIEWNIEENKKKEPDNERLLSLFEKLEFGAFTKKYGLSRETKKADIKLTYDFSKLLYIKDSFYYLICGEEIYIKCEDTVICGKLKEHLSELKPIFENEKIGKYSYGIKEHIISLDELGIKYKNPVFDIRLAAYVTDPSENDYRLMNIAFSSLKVSLEEEYEAIAVLPEICGALNDRLSDTGTDRLFYTVEMPVLSILSKMQIRGIRADKKALMETGDKFLKRIEELTSEITELAGEEFNINSTKQLGEILFEKLGLKSGKKTKTGYSTGIEVLEALKGEHPIIEKLIEYRMVTKLKSTYIDGMLNFTDDEGIIHSNFHQTVTQTGRLSSSEPNLQNIPVKKKEGRELRKVFVPREEGNVFVSADYSQIELRVLAQICGDENLIDAFKNGEDIHRQAASKIYKVAPIEVTELMRGQAKAVNFGIIYGKTEFSLAKDLGISRKEAKEIIESYLNEYPNIRGYMYNIVESAKENGYVKTLFGRIRYIKELTDRNYNMRQFGERIALNTPIQGTAADIIKIAMVRVSERLEKELPGAYLVLQIHDELIIEAKPEDKEKAGQLLKECMETAVKLNVPLTAPVEYSYSL